MVPSRAADPISAPPHLWTRARRVQLPHIHPPPWLSGVYYVTVPDGVGRDDGDRFGWIEFGRIGYTFPLPVEPERRPLRPQEGLMVLFPSYFDHRSLPFRSDGERISVAFDAVPAL